MTSKRKPTPQNAPCVVCGEVKSRNPKNFMIFCDGAGCNDCYHAWCLTPPLGGVPIDDWFCDPCLEGKQRRGILPEFAAHQKQVPDRARKREQLGLSAEGPATMEDVSLLLQHAYKDPHKRENLVREFDEFSKKHAEAKRELDIWLLYVAEKVKKNCTADTIRGYIATIRSEKGLKNTPYPPELERILLSADKYATVADRSKLPMTVGMLSMLETAIATTYPPETYLYWRDWTYYLLSFLGCLRGNDAKNLEWRCVMVEWKQGSKLRRGKPGELHPPPGDGWQPESVSLQILESKADQTGKGATVLIQANPSGRPQDCPVRALGALRLRQTWAGESVFGTYKRGEAVSEDTMRSRLKKYLGTFMEAEDVEQYALHSLRRGGATHAINEGRSIEEIKVHGRWASDAVYLYTRFKNAGVLSVSSTLIAGLNSLNLPRDKL